MKSARSPALGPCQRVAARLALQHSAVDKLLLIYGEAPVVPRWLNAALNGVRFTRDELEEVAPDIPGFESWYAPYREAFATDPLWRWAFTARDKTIHQHDLADHSRMSVDLIASYRRAPLASWQPGSLFTSVNAIVATMPPEHLTAHVREHGVLRVSRRWVDNELPDWEILSALDTVYDRLTALVADLFRHCGTDFPSPTQRAESFGADELRRHYFAVKDGMYLLHSERHPPVAEELAAELEASGKNSMLLSTLKQATGLREAARIYFEYMSEAMARTGRCMPLAVFFSGTRTIAICELQFTSRAHKYGTLHELAVFAQRICADGVALLVEAWGAPQGKLATGQVPSRKTAGDEALVLQGGDSSGAVIHLSSTIHRGFFRRGRIKRMGLPSTDMLVPVSVVPFLEMWGVLDRLNLPADADFTRDSMVLD
jgi:hypothetical protein